MNDLKLKINLKPVSINAYYKTILIKGTPRRAVSKDGKAFQKLFLNELYNYSHLIHGFFASIDPERDMIYFTIDHFSPTFYTKDKRISSNSLDSNAPVKLIEDIFFDFIGMNDKIIKRSTGEKWYGRESYFEITISRVQLVI